LLSTVAILKMEKVDRSTATHSQILASSHCFFGCRLQAISEISKNGFLSAKLDLQATYLATHLDKRKEGHFTGG